MFEARIAPEGCSLFAALRNGHGRRRSVTYVVRMLRRKVATALLVVVLAGCGTRQDAGSGAIATVPASPSPSASPTAQPSPSPSPSPTPLTVPFPDLPVIVGTATGDLYFRLQNGAPAGAKVHACDGVVGDIFAYGRQAAIFCSSPGSGPSGSALYLWDEATARVTQIAKTEARMAAFDGLGSLAYVIVGRTEPSAPISMTKLMLRDLRSGADTSLDERYGVAFELRTTGEGVAVWRPKNSLSFVRSDADAGTWIIRGTTLAKLSQHRLIEGDKGRDLLESEPSGESGGSTYAVLKTTTEQRLTPSDISNEKALAFLPDGRAVVWRPISGFSGVMVIYRGTAVERMDRGAFSEFHAMTSGEWIVGLEYSGAPSLTLRAYRPGDGAFASALGGSITAIAMLGPKK